ncbi:hypothetical protein U1Q18_031508 [Sarracenia purpurea var. burkii]
MTATSNSVNGADQLVGVFMAYKPLQSQEGKCNAGLSFANVDLVASLTLLDKDFPLDSSSGLLRCAVCQADQTPSEGLSVNSRPYFSPTSKPSEGPFLCSNCRKKKDSMEGKRPSEINPSLELIQRLWKKRLVAFRTRRRCLLAAAAGACFAFTYARTLPLARCC